MGRWIDSGGAQVVTDVAFEFYTEAETAQHSRNEARRIRTRVDQARKSPHAAGIRWPFELLQNALDAGPRDGRSTVTVRLQDDGTTMLFQHDGAPFALNELAALVSGGSSKDYESETTTGRFGTGFLVHTCACRTGAVARPTCVGVTLRSFRLDIGPGRG